MLLLQPVIHFSVRRLKRSLLLGRLLLMDRFHIAPILFFINLNPSHTDSTVTCVTPSIRLVKYRISKLGLEVIVLACKIAFFLD